jgi:hypothetical protein
VERSLGAGVWCRVVTIFRPIFLINGPTLFSYINGKAFASFKKFLMGWGQLVEIVA